MICQPPSDRCGLYFLPPPTTEGAEGADDDRWSQHRRRVPQGLPLASTAIAANVQDLYAETAVTQTYSNDTGADITKAVYSFPLHNRACVNKFEVEIDGVVTEGRCLEKQQAKQTFDAAVAGGGSAQLVEQEARDVFQMSVGGLKAGQTVTVRLTHVAVLPIVGDAVEVFVPTHVAPRYGGGEVHGAADAAKTRVSIEVTCAMASDITTIRCDTHTVSAAVGVGGDQRRGSLNLAAGAAALGKDFVVHIATVTPHQPRLLLEKSTVDGSCTAAVTLAPKLEFEDCKAEFVFVIDRSGSMGGSDMEQAASALQLFLRSLPHDCYFNIIGFGSRFEKLFPASVKLDSLTLATATEHLHALRADLGGTEILQPVLAALGAPAIEGYARQVFVLTDGQVGNTDEVVAAVSRERSARCFALGFGDRASRALVEGIAKAGRGATAFVTGDDLDRAVVGQLKRAMQPSLTGATLEWVGSAVLAEAPAAAAVAVATAQEEQKGATGLLGSLLSYTSPAVAKAKTPPKTLQAPHAVPPVFSETRFAVFALNADPDAESVRVTANTPDGPLSVVLPVSARTEGSLLQTLAGREAIADLENGTSWMHSAGRTPGPDEVKGEVVRLGTTLGLVSKHTSYVATQPPADEPRRAMMRRTQGGLRRTLTLGVDRSASCGMLSRQGGGAPTVRVLAQQRQKLLTRGLQGRGHKSASRPESASLGRAPPRPRARASARSAPSPPPPMCANTMLCALPRQSMPQRHAVEYECLRGPPPVANSWKRLVKSAHKVDVQPLVLAEADGGLTKACCLSDDECSDSLDRRDSTADSTAAPEGLRSRARRASRNGPVSSKPEPMAVADPLKRLVLLQGFDGSFRLSVALAAAVGQPLAELEQAAAAAGIQKDTFGAMVAIVFLRTALSAREAEWELVAQKTLKWIARGSAPAAGPSSSWPVAEALFATG